MKLNLEEIIPLACDWTVLQEKEIIDRGVPLSVEMVEFASKLGIQNSDNIRVMYVDKIPMPDNPILEKACYETSLISDNTAGLTLRYGIYIRSDCKSDNGLISHELVHVSQYEKLGGIAEFLKQYLYEVITVGYPEAPMEQEAINKSRGA